MEDKRDGTGTIVSGVVKVAVASCVSVRFPDQFVTCVHCHSHQQRGAARGHSVPILQRRGLTLNIVIYIRRGANAAGQNKDGTKQKKSQSKKHEALKTAFHI